MTPGGGGGGGGGGVVVVVFVFFFFWAEVGLRRFLLECLSTRGFCPFFFPQARSKFDIHSDGY